MVMEDNCEPRSARQNFLGITSKNCTINARLGNSAPPGFITAQLRSSLDDPSGFVFEGGFVVGTGEVSLGRAWGPYSRVIFHRTKFSSVVSPEGWNAWDFRGHEDKFTYAEVDCTGPGANTSKRVKWEKKLTPSQLQAYSLSSFINKDKWLAKIPTIFL
ncbi:putative pectinesterase 52 [Lotus japonicus]|uniref:putative pectinesterase 52 n=1 Tax=Lotus japonicus TaxID=34305 RepID=UPI002586784E|nr:putative pectinesterase 52 [Lotus japonicus]